MNPLALLMTATALTNAPADLIIRNAHIVTVDQHFSTARAAAIRDGKFIAVGSETAVLKTQGPKTRVIDLHGQTVLPGFNDTHVHLSSGKDLETQVDLTQHPFDQADPGGDRGAGKGVEARRMDRRDARLVGISACRRTPAYPLRPRRGGAQ